MFRAGKSSRLLRILLGGALFFSLNNCKTYERRQITSPNSGPEKTDNDDSGKNKDTCAFGLTNVKSLPPVDPKTLAVTKIELFEYERDGYMVPHIKFFVPDAPDSRFEPNIFYYKVCDLKRRNTCHEGSTGSFAKFDTKIPRGTVKLTAWSCRQAESPMVSGSSSVVKTVDGLKYFCGKPYSEQNFQILVKNPSSSTGKRRYEFITKKREEIRVASKKAYNLIAASGATANMPRAQQVATQSITAMGPDLYAEMVSTYALDLANGFVQASEIKKSSPNQFNLSEEQSANCIPQIPVDVGTPAAPFNPYATEDDDQKLIEEDTPGTETPAEKPDDEASKEELAEEARVAKLKSQCDLKHTEIENKGLGSVAYDSETESCIHTDNQGQTMVIDPELDAAEESLASDQSDDRKANPAAKAGGGVLIAVGLVAAGGGATSLYFGNKAKKAAENTAGTAVEGEAKDTTKNPQDGPEDTQKTAVAAADGEELDTKAEKKAGDLSKETQTVNEEASKLSPEQLDTPKEAQKAISENERLFLNELETKIQLEQGKLNSLNGLSGAANSVDGPKLQADILAQTKTVEDLETIKKVLDLEPTERMKFFDQSTGELRFEGRNPVSRQRLEVLEFPDLATKISLFSGAEALDAKTPQVEKTTFLKKVKTQLSDVTGKFRALSPDTKIKAGKAGIGIGIGIVLIGIYTQSFGLNSDQNLNKFLEQTSRYIVERSQKIEACFQNIAHCEE